MPSYLTHCPANFWGGGVGDGGGGVIYILVPTPLASNTFHHHVLIFGVRPLNWLDIVGCGKGGPGGRGGVIYILVPSPLASNTFLHLILIFGVRPLVVFPPPPLDKKPWMGFELSLAGDFQ